MKKRRIYISGPMSGIPRKEYLRRFSKAEQALLNFYPKVVNPCTLPPCKYPLLYRLLKYRKTLAWDLRALRTCTHIFMMDGWRQSRGARLEHRKAREWGLTIIYEQ